MPPAHPLASLVDRAAPITGDELYHLPDLGPCELVEGHVRSVHPTSWRHGRLVTEVASQLRDFVRAQTRGVVMSGDIGIYTAREPDTVRGADVVVLSPERRADIQSNRFLDVAPERVAEIHPPGVSESALRTKTREFFQIGVQQVWLFNSKHGHLRRFRSPTQVAPLEPDDCLQGEGFLNGLRLPLSTVFDVA